MRCAAYVAGRHAAAGVHAWLHAQAVRVAALLLALPLPLLQPLDVVHGGFQVAAVEAAAAGPVRCSGCRLAACLCCRRQRAEPGVCYCKPVLQQGDAVPRAC